MGIFFSSKLDRGRRPRDVTGDEAQTARESIIPRRGVLSLSYAWNTIGLVLISHREDQEEEEDDGPAPTRKCPAAAMKAGETETKEDESTLELEEEQEIKRFLQHSTRGDVPPTGTNRRKTLVRTSAQPEKNGDEGQCLDLFHPI